MKNREYQDLGRLAVNRCRDSFVSVAQLMDDDLQIIALLLTVAHDFVDQAGFGLSKLKGVPEEEGVAKALLTVIESFGVDALKAMAKEVE